MKKIILFSFTVAASYISLAQTIAANWTATDCNSVSHTLFNELDNGKVIVFAWVMPCGSCISGAKTAYTEVQKYAVSQPGKVLFYISDDAGNDNCSSLTSWITSNNIGDLSKMTIFGNAGNAIDEAAFGGTGMPHIAVMAGSDHKIYFNKMNSAANSASGIETAINDALAVLNVAAIPAAGGFAIKPNPAGDHVVISNSKAIKNITITSLSGQVVYDVQFTNARTNPTVSLNSIPGGVYIVSITDADGNKGTQKLVKQ